MSFIVKGIDLPKGNTAEIIIRIQPNGEVRDSHGILLDVKAIQIPKDHGDIKDVSKLRVSEYDCEGEVSWYTIRAVDMWDIDNAPTILESEK